MGNQLPALYCSTDNVGDFQASDTLNTVSRHASEPIRHLRELRGDLLEVIDSRSDVVRPHEEGVELL